MFIALAQARPAPEMCALLLCSVLLYIRLDGAVLHWVGVAALFSSMSDRNRNAMQCAGNSRCTPRHARPQRIRRRCAGMEERGTVRCEPGDSAYFPWHATCCHREIPEHDMHQ